jgi:MFS family permease
MFSLGFIYQAGQVSFPKIFDLRLSNWVGQGTLGVGLVVSAVYAVAAFMQIVGGHLADRYPLKRVYLGALVLQAPMLLAVASAYGLPLVTSVTLAVMLSSAALPAENMLLARYAPRHHQSLVFGLKFVLALGTAPLAISLVSRINEATGGFGQLYLALAGVAALTFGAALALPGESDREVQ